MADIHPQTSSPLFQLPPEIRETIQRYALTENNLLTATRPAEFREAIFRVHDGPDSIPALMRTCKKMYLEMRPFAFTEIVVHFTADAATGQPRIGVLSHGNLHHERIRRISFVVDTPDRNNTVQPKWTYFLHALLIRCIDVDRLDFEFSEGMIRKEVESQLSESKERRANGTETPFDELVLTLYPMPVWVEEVARNPTLRRVCFEGDLPPIWLENLRRTSEGRIQVLVNGVGFKEKEVPMDLLADMKDPLKWLKEEEVRDPQVHFVHQTAWFGQQ